VTGRWGHLSRAVGAIVASLLAANGLTGGAAPAGAGTAPKRTVEVGDNYFAPDALRVRAGTRVVWRWPGFEASGQIHDVALRSGPKGVKRFHSAPAASDYSYRRTLRVPGLYKFLCTYHEEMAMTVRVRR
jgi:plastocyanin